MSQPGVDQSTSRIQVEILTGTLPRSVPWPQLYAFMKDTRSKKQSSLTKLIFVVFINMAR
jgi:hypothetical protein